MFLWVTEKSELEACCSLGGWAAAETSLWQIRKTQTNRGHDLSLYHSQVSVWLYGLLYWEFRLILKEMSCFLFPGRVWHIWCIKHVFSGYSCSYAYCAFRHFRRMLLFSMCWWSQNFRVAGVSWEGRRSPVLLSWQPLRLCSAEHLPRWGWQFAWKIGSGEKTPLHVAASDTNLGRDLSGEAWPFLGSENLTVSRQKREWDLSISSGNHSCQRKGVR